ncbi:MAG: hypothetical protein O6934_03225 [SAR324 cluster bacterium]|nr:hypothetical protein [SAR324 cluster bacterium]
MNLLHRGTVPALILFFMLGWGSSVFGQIINFKPLERGDYTEEEEKLIVLRGMTLSFEYAAQVLRESSKELTPGQEITGFAQDFRLGLRTVFHRDVEFHLVLEPSVRAFQGDNSRERREVDGRISEAQPLALNAREAYLLYKFNPRSGLILGKQEISIGDRRGKVFNGIAPGITYDCRVGTWCMPFGGIKTGPNSTDWIFHWALEYTAWDDKNQGYNNDTFKFEIFRIVYDETNVPLGKNRGPGFFNSDAPADGTVVDPSQETDASTPGVPIYYDVDSQEYFGIRFIWESGIFFWNLDLTSSQGDRDLHRYRPTGTLPNDLIDLGGAPRGSFRQSVSGTAWETEVGFRSAKWKLGLRILNADGDDGLAKGDKAGLAKGLRGYYEITPGSYRGTRLYFNGSDNNVESGAGLGHSVNNIKMIGFFYDFSDPQGKEMDYSLGIYKLELNRAVLDDNGDKQTNVGVEFDNLLTFYLHKAIKLQIEINIISTQGAFSVNDFTRPNGETKGLFLQGIGRFVYSF